MSAQSKRIVLAIIGIIIVLGGYSLIWKHTADELEQFLLKQIAHLREQGHKVEYKSFTISGYPTHLKAVFTQPSFSSKETPESTITVSESLQCESKIWTFSNIDFKTVGQTSISVPYSATIENIQGQYRIPILVKSDHYWIQASDLQSTSQDYPIHLKNLELSFTRDNAKDAPSAEDIIQYEVTANHLTLDEKQNGLFSKPIERINIHGTMSGEWPQGDFKSALSSWGQKEGMFELKTLDIDWDQISVHANGSLSFDDQLQPVAAFGAEIKGVDELLDSLKATKHIDNKTESMIRLGLNFLSTRKETPDSTQVYNISLSIQENTFHLGPIPLFTIPKIDWSSIIAN